MFRRAPAASIVLTAFVLAGFSAPARADRPAAVSGALAARAFERFKALEGTWLGESTKGWTEKIRYRVIAKQSCVMETSFDAHPNEMMVTMICPDGDRLLLTHYCVATNQPRLVLTSATPDAAEVTFEFLDGTNLPTRDKGHMDKAVFRFVGDDEFTTRWTWYQDGKESWMEEVRNKRLTDEESAAAAGETSDFPK